MAEQSKRFRLRVVGGAEQVPRLLAAYGRSCDGEFALVLRPAEERGVLVLMRKQDGARFWRAPSAPTETSDAPSMPSWPIEPAEAVTTTADGPRLWVVTEGTAHLRPVTTGERRDADIVVRPALSGMAGSDFRSRERALAAGREAGRLQLPALRQRIAELTR